MVAYDFQRFRPESRRVRQGDQLKCQAFGQVAGADAGRLEILQMLQRDLQILELDAELFGQHGLELRELLREIAVLVQRLDQQCDERAVALRKIGERKLRNQVVPQRRLLRCELRIIVVVSVFTGA
jgi:hypothetical protein